MSEAYRQALMDALGMRPAEEVPQLGAPDVSAFQQLERLQREALESSLSRVQKGEEQFLDEAFVEDQLGGRVVSKEIPDFFFQNRLARREELPRAVEYVQQSGYLPEGAEAVGAKTRSGGFEVLYRTPDDPKVFYRVNEPGPSRGDIGYYAPDPTSLETWAAVAAEVAGPKGLGRAGKYLLDAVAAAGGRTVDEVIEDASVGGEVDPARLRDAAIESGAVALMGRGVGEFAESALNLRRGRGFRTEAAGARPGAAEVSEAVRVSEEMGVRPPSMGALGASPVLQRAEAQAMTVDAELQRRRLDQLASYYDRLYGVGTKEGEFSGDYQSLTDEAIDSILDGERRKMRAQVERGIRTAGLRLEDQRPELGGRVLGEAIDDYRKVSGEKGRRLYDDLFSVAQEEGVEFDLSNVQQAAQDVLEPLTLEADGTEFGELLRRSILNPQSVTEQELAVLSRGPGPNEVAIPRDYGPRLGQIMSALTEASSVQGTERLEALRKLTTYLREYSEPSSGIARTPEEAMASRLFSALRKDVRQSTGNQRFQEAADLADNFWANRASMLDSFSFVDQLDKVGGGELVYRSFLSNPTEAMAQQAMGLMPPARKSEFQAAFINDLLSDPKQIGARLENLGEGVVRRILPESARGILGRFQREIGRLDSGALATVLRTEMDAGERFKSLIENNDSQGLRLLLRDQQIPADEVRARVMQNLLDDSSSIERGRIILDPQKYIRSVERYKEKGFLQTLTPAQRRVVEDFEKLSSFLRSAADAGSSIAGAELASSQITAASNPARALSARLKMAQLGLAARMGQNETYIRSFAGAEVPEGYPLTRATMLALTQVSRDLADRFAGPELEERRREE